MQINSFQNAQNVSDNWMSCVAKDSSRYRQMRINKGGGIMVWLMVMPNSLIAHKIIEKNFRSADNIQVFQETVVPISKLNYENKFYFQEYNCSVNKAKTVKNIYGKQ